MLDSIILKAPAKLNLFLQTVGKREDGYHLIESVMQSVDLYDEVFLKKTVSGITLTCDDVNIPTDDRNIAIKITKKVFEYKNIEPGVKIHIRKKIPYGAGLGGGSADGGATLLGLNNLFSLNLTKTEMIDIAKSVGADIPFMTVGGTAITTGIGEKINKISDLKECYFVIVKPKCSINTREAYERIDKRGNSDKREISNIVKAIKAGSIENLSKYLYNEFEIVAPNEIFSIKEELKKAGALNSLMTGSGSAVFGVFKDYDTADFAREQLNKKYANVFVSKPVNVI